MDKIRILEYTLFGLDEVQRWSEIPPCQESNAADEREKLVAYRGIGMDLQVTLP